MPSELGRQLAAIVGPDYVAEDPATLTAYSRDATPLHRGRPDIVAFPRSAEEVAGILRLASAGSIPVVTRGGGSNLCAAAVPHQGGIVLALSRMTTIKQVSPEELLAVCEPGVTTANLARAAEGHGLLFPPDPGSHEVATIGGNIATCAGGLRGLKYGVTRNYVLGLQAVLATGEVIRTGGRLVKDVAGYDLTRLLVGSEGTLAVVTEATLALLPRPATSRYGVAYFRSLREAGAAVAAIVAAGVVPATLEFLDATCIATVEDYAHLGLRADAGALLLFGEDGSPEHAEAAVARMAQIAGDGAALEVTLARDVAASDALLAARRCSLPALARRGSLTVLEDIAVPRPRLAEAVERIAAVAERHDLLIGTFGHAGDGNLHPTCVADPNEPGVHERIETAFDEIFAMALELGGTISGEHGIGLTKLKYLPARLGADHMALLRRIKAAFDPAGILNPGKLGS